METKKAQQRFPEEFKIEAVEQVADRGRLVAEVGVLFDVSAHSPDICIKLYGVPAERPVDLYAGRALRAGTA